ncbi:aminotransferase-like domain-containing protein [Piscinibacter terrae]|uniref:PLP-dependent aminotransferase family protein n=1 Tax=Piscinibacter terrae TaxID=2496871 RepID=A0A3N7HW06_9BURK|nr:PLP-dependent aminotransferase family protein [Albitalea terrae]RQP25171.1 PLP-dependent aminotransferase family protein [Albitalea terrae]
MFPLDRQSTIPLADQIESRLVALIEAGQLPAGAKLTSIRSMATQLGVSPNTVITAYDRLVAQGLVDSRGTAGFFVCEAASPEPLPSRLEAGEEHDAVWLVQQAHDQRANMLPASSGALPVSWLEDAIPAAVVQRGLARSVGGMAARCPPQGMPELRERLAMFMRGQGIATDASRVLTTFGGTHAIDLICRSFLKAGDTVLVETPGYHLLFDRLREAGVNMVGIMRGHDGPDLDQIEAACIEHRPRLFFIQSVLHNPTGWACSAANLHRVLMLAERHDMLLAEDDVHGHFHAGPATRLAQLSELRRVIYYSSFCKALSPALRVGYVAAEPSLLKVLLRTKIQSVLTTSSLNENVLLELLAGGRLRKHLDRLQQKLATARNVTARELRRAGMLLDRPAEGGLFLWGTLPAGVEADTLVREAYREGILLAGAAFDAGNEDQRHLRFNVVYAQHPKLIDFLSQRLQALSQATRVIQRAASRSHDRA